MEQVPFSPVGLDAGQDTFEQIDEIKVQKYRACRKELCAEPFIMTHIPKNPFCQGCLRAKLNAKQARSRRIKSEANAFGDTVTADHLIARDADGGGTDNEKVAILIKDHYSNWMMLYPTGGKSADEAAHSIADFQGNKKEHIKLMYTDNAPKLILAASRFKLKHNTSPTVVTTGKLSEKTGTDVTRMSAFGTSCVPLEDEAACDL